MTLYPTAFMVHSCVIIHATGTYTEDDYGNQIPVTTSTTSICRFSQQKEQITDGNNIYTKSTPKIALPPTATIEENDTITSTEIGYTDTFSVKSVKAVYYPTVKTISHFSCELAAVV